jgi:RNA polymerase-binding protein DksA
MQSGTSRYSDSVLQEFKRLIETKLEKAQNQVDQLREQLTDIFENSNEGYDPDDTSSLDQQKDMLQTRIHRAEKHMRDLENALIRIHNKSYGICQVTGQLIDKRRLLAVPTTTKSLEGKTQEMTASSTKPLREVRAKSPRLLKPKIKAMLKSTPARPSTAKVDLYEDLNYDESEDLDFQAEDDGSDDEFKFISLDEVQDEI